ncbi:LysM domain-containing protein [Oscillospiraceae bacterium NTUH-002-81]|nr:LysM domain-containing protein [Oscillospiraceae bacterium NTUH-002-81]
MEDRNTNFDRCYGFTHVIQKGDTLYKLSKQYHVKVSALILANPFVNIYNLQVGDEICIPRIRPVVIPVTPYPQPPYTRPGVIQPRSAEEDNGRSVDSGEQMDSGEMEDAMHAYDNGMRQRTTDDPMRREQERTTVVPENQKMSTPVGDGSSWDREDVPAESEMELSELPPAGTDRKMPETGADSASVETASCPCEEERIRAMTVDALLEEWDLSYAAFASCLELLKKM